MADLYTSLSRAKQILMATRDWRGDGPPPPPVAMTPVPEKVQHIINPAYTIGLGALRECGVIEEDGRTLPCSECRSVEGCQDRGLQCPVCGEWKHRLARHLNSVHGAVGGQRTVADALSIPPSTRMVSRAERRRYRLRITPSAVEGLAAARRKRKPLSPKMASALRARRKTNRNSMAEENARNTCTAQIRTRMVDLQTQLGRSPAISDAERLDPGLAMAVIRVYGSWNNGKMQVGLRCNPRGASWSYKREAVLSALGAWYDMHGRLPLRNEAKRPTRRPLIPSVPAVLRAMEADTWPQAMQQAAAALGIRGGRYGLPERKKAA